MSEQSERHCEYAAIHKKGPQITSIAENLITHSTKLLCTGGIGAPFKCRNEKLQNNKMHSESDIKGYNDTGNHRVSKIQSIKNTSHAYHNYKEQNQYSAIGTNRLYLSDVSGNEIVEMYAITPIHSKVRRRASACGHKWYNCKNKSTIQNNMQSMV